MANRLSEYGECKRLLATEADLQRALFRAECELLQAQLHTVMIKAARSGRPWLLTAAGTVEVIFFKRRQHLRRWAPPARAMLRGLTQARKEIRIFRWTHVSFGE